VEAFRARGAMVYAAAADGDAELYALDLTRPTAFLFGNEAWGLPDEVAALADRTVRVPIVGSAESLNLAAAATICLFEAARQRRHGGPGALENVMASAAHDIRSPITTLGGFALTLLNRWRQMTDEQRELMLKGIVIEAEAWWGHDGPIRVSATSQDAYVDVEVFRSGTNLTQHDADGLFAPRPPGSGAGSKIGLFVARGVAEALGGSATAMVADGLRL